MEDRQPVIVYLPGNVKKNLAACAAEQGLSLSALLRRIILIEANKVDLR